MKKRLIVVSNILFAVAAVIALVAGINLTSMLDLSQDIVSEAFPANYNVHLVKNNTVISDAEVFFNGNNAVISSDSFSGTIDINDAVFTCTSGDILSKNIVRSGMLFSLLSVLNIIAAAVPVYAATCLRAKACRIRRRRVVKLDCVSGNQQSSAAISAAA